jgi:sarcosine oxidase
MVRISRRGVLASAVAAGVAGSLAKGSEDKKVSKPAWDSIVIGAGVFGAWTAWCLRKAGQRVLLLDAFGAAHARASSGGESRLTRGSYGSDEVYTRFALNSLPQWKWLSDQAGLPVFHPTGVLFFFQKREAYVDQSLEVHRRLALPTQELDRAVLEQKYPQLNWKDIEVGLFEPQFGVLMARRAVQTLVKAFVKAGGEYRVAAVKPPAAEKPLAQIDLADGSTLSAGNYVFACGPWLPKVFPRLLGPRIFPTRQEVFFFAPPSGDARFGAAALPGWADFNNGDIYYGTPDLEGRGFKIAQTAWRRPARWPMCARTWPGAFRHSRTLRSMRSACANTRTAATATCSSTGIPRRTMCCWWARDPGMGSSMGRRSGGMRRNC